MRQISLYLVLFVVSILAISCYKNHQMANIEEVFALCETNPDSALYILNKMNKHDLPEKELPAFCLAYTMAQDKSGLDVDDDSLIRIAYNAYANSSDTRFYSQSQYYMGKFYALRDSIEKAITCFTQSIESATHLQDTALQCLALERLSSMTVAFDRDKALRLARSAESLYSHYSGRKLSNHVFFSLQTAYCLTMSDSLQQSLQVVRNALIHAIGSKDSLLINNVYQEMSVLYKYMGKADSSLVFAKMAKDYAGDSQSYNYLILAGAYCDNDSLDQAEDIYNNALRGSGPVQKYTIYTQLYEIAIRRDDKIHALAYADSAYKCIGKMYSESLGQRNQHFEKLLMEEKIRSDAEHVAYRTKWITWVVLIVLCFVVFNYAMYRKRAKERIISEQERACQEIRHEKEMHQQEILFREEQYTRDLRERDFRITIMRKYLMERMEIAKIVETVKDGRKKAVFSDEDWKEIEIFLENSECNFVSRLRSSFPELREKDVRLMMLLRLRIPQRGIAEYYGIGEKAVKQKLFLYKGKVGIQDEKTSLREFIEAF